MTVGLLTPIICLLIHSTTSTLFALTIKCEKKNDENNFLDVIDLFCCHTFQV